MIGPLGGLLYTTMPAMQLKSSFGSLDPSSSPSLAPRQPEAHLTVRKAGKPVIFMPITISRPMESCERPRLLLHVHGSECLCESFFAGQRYSCTTIGNIGSSQIFPPYGRCAISCVSITDDWEYGPETVAVLPKI